MRSSSFKDKAKRQDKRRRRYRYDFGRGAFAFGGAKKQAELLETEGVEVVDGKVDLVRFEYRRI